MNLSIVLSTSPIKSNPSIQLIKHALDSIPKFIQNYNSSEVIITCDGVLTPSYREFINNLEKYCEHYPLPIKVIVHDKHLHLCGSLEEAVKQATHDNLFIMQHDHEIIRTIDLTKIQNLLKVPEIKHLRLNFRTNKSANLDKGVKTVNFPGVEPVCYTEAWSDICYFTTKEYMIDTVFHHCNTYWPVKLDSSLAEDFTINDNTHTPFSKWGKDITKQWYDKSINNNKIWKRKLFPEQILTYLNKITHYGTYIFGAVGESRYINRRDGNIY